VKLFLSNFVNFVLCGFLPYESVKIGAFGSVRLRNEILEMEIRSGPCHNLPSVLRALGTGRPASQCFNIITPAPNAGKLKAVIGNDVILGKFELE
jgi:hypothetical protein